MKAWERRLKDLSHILVSCERTYFEPELFRMNLNQFLQTARTVTFIIQKNKNDIPNFTSWYDDAVIKNWNNDVLMTWAKDSRNKIEKEGDLELHSKLSTTLLFLYDEKHDIHLECGRNELINYNVKKLIRLAQKKLPTGFMDSASIKIERRWVANELPEWELLNAIIYIYGKIHTCCVSLSQHLNSHFDDSIASPSQFTSSRINTVKTNYVKLSDLHLSSIKISTLNINDEIKPPEDFINIFKCSEKPNSLKNLVEFHGELAKSLFNNDGYHIAIIFFYDDNFNLIHALSTTFNDQADKIIFWRQVAELIPQFNIHEVIFVSEAWQRMPSYDLTTPIKNMPITGESLNIFGLDINKNCIIKVYEIIRDNDTALINEKPSVVGGVKDGIPNYFIPVITMFDKLSKMKKD
ncbi:hypothetical protein [Aeromonas veronii]|uniref:hypothetical protein n=1 Tax=Aeromonas veronii TaxID=654 RepID=UPI003F671813